MNLGCSGLLEQCLVSTTVNLLCNCKGTVKMRKGLLFKLMYPNYIYGHNFLFVSRTGHSNDAVVRVLFYNFNVYDFEPDPYLLFWNAPQP